jgi:hypothetical protein
MPQRQFRLPKGSQPSHLSGLEGVAVEGELVLTVRIDDVK